MSVVNSQITQLGGVSVGHWTDESSLTGCTAVLLPPGAVASREVRGGAPATRDLDALAPDKAVTSIDAVLLTGGSAFGLASADGVMRFLEEQRRGVPTPGGLVPIVPTMALFDLAVGNSSVRPTAENGYQAASSATGPSFAVGRIGAGVGAFTSHWRGEGDRKPGGIQYAETVLGDLVVGALCAVNAYGDVDRGNTAVSLDSVADLKPPFTYSSDRVHTTIGVVISNARLDKTACFVVAQGAHDGLSRALTPPHTRYDGDGFVAVATGEVEADVDTVRLMALDAVCRAIRSAPER
ncbi:P1 family peptidase [Mycolicibacterium setense]|uniref:P1 family peptidase n=1 Tax=Mycolicibacterium setense TaxID=431269 RepID=UPI000573115E|nr:P1 family peptidase [Mycolicibacterium setense]KHO24641.1 peptidase S58 DmpA [Mycolicibacterium setense]MCV7110174.1 P1 family peptidase [Mycolicibacterium setense]